MFQKSSLPITHQGGTQAREEGAQRIKTGLPQSMCKQHLIIKLKKHTNEIKTFSKWAAALRPDFVGPWPAILYLCLNWAPGKAAVGKARFWCQQEGRAQDTASGGRKAAGDSVPTSPLPPLLGHHHGLGLSLSTRPDPSHVAGDLRLAPHVHWGFHPLIRSLSPISIWSSYLFSKIKAKTGKKKSQKLLLTLLPLWL